MTAIRIRGLVKRFGRTTAVDAVDLDVPSGTLFFLLGPSGCGKTTLLRMIAGFAEPDAGSIAFGEREVTHVAANRRNTGMVFQGYALWPHMSVRENVAFGLRVRKVPASQRQQRVSEALERAQMLEYADRKPNELSGGQQQRVALARALVIEPTVLLLDEPLSNLDAKLRVQMRSTIKQICKEAGITAIYVTHDQGEALSMADQLAVMREGKVAQVGTPREVYHRPASRFVADFLGESNFLDAVVVGREDGLLRLDTAAGALHSSVFPGDLADGQRVICSIRPEAVKLSEGDGASAAGSAGANVVQGERHDVTYLGELAQYQVRIGESLLLKAVELNPALTPPDSPQVALTFDPGDVVVLRG